MHSQRMWARRALNSCNRVTSSQRHVLHLLSLSLSWSFPLSLSLCLSLDPLSLTLCLSLETCIPTSRKASAFPMAGTLQLGHFAAHNVSLLKSPRSILARHELTTPARPFCTRPSNCTQSASLKRTPHRQNSHELIVSAQDAGVCCRNSGRRFRPEARGDITVVWRCAPSKGARRAV